MIVGQDAIEVAMGIARGHRFGSSEARERRREPVERRGQGVELAADSAPVASALGRKALGGEGEHVLVGRLDGVESLAQVLSFRGHAPTLQDWSGRSRRT